jgi:hypothetical protein
MRNYIGVSLGYIVLHHITQLMLHRFEQLILKQIQSHRKPVHTYSYPGTSSPPPDAERCESALSLQMLTVADKQEGEIRELGDGSERTGEDLVDEAVRRGD